jgi:uncharacterized protein YeeX (DUF496 family)
MKADKKLLDEIDDMIKDKGDRGKIGKLLLNAVADPKKAEGYIADVFKVMGGMKEGEVKKIDDTILKAIDFLKL